MTFDQWVLSHRPDQIAPSGFPWTFWIKGEVLVPGDWPGYMGCKGGLPQITVDHFGVLTFPLDVAYRMFNIHRVPSDRNHAALVHSILTELGGFHVRE